MTNDAVEATETTLLSELARGAQLAFANAEQLFREASLLRESGTKNRALFLHQISMEECAKVDLLGAWATSLLMGTPVDISKLARAMANHKAKNRVNAYMLKPGDDEVNAREQADWKGALDAFKAMQAAFHERSNNAKNASLYVDFVEGTFVTPDERITDDMVAEIAETNRIYLGLMHPKVQMLNRWETDSAPVKEMLAAFRQRMEELREQHPDEPDRALAIVLEEMLASELVKRPASAPEDST